MTPTSFGAGDVVRLTGTGLPSAASGASVTVGGVRGTVLAATGTTLDVRVPPCVAAGQVPIVVSLAGGVSTNGLNATYASSTTAPASWSASTSASVSPGTIRSTGSRSRWVSKGMRFFSAGFCAWLEASNRSV